MKIASPNRTLGFALLFGATAGLLTLRDDTSQSVPGVAPKDQVLRYSPDGKYLWTRQPNLQPVRIEQVNLKTGARSALLPDFSPRRENAIMCSDLSGERA